MTASPDPPAPFVRPAVAGLTPYVPGKPVEDVQRELGLERVVKLASNEGPFPPFPAPIAAGQQIANLNVYRGDRLVLEAPLYAAEGIERGNLRQRAIDGATELVIGLIRMGVSSIGTKKG